ncbi:DUF6286 domain-containing protein [Rubrobacter indicoceani]|uniref:DUF6286 domain-containing protein n=1 Tax=Rubrobacter indicoceani TaxID=2051957 RepID=UPI000E5B96CE|nr:DUF6286 domain-containing protein [Rubrobacter indicoceani]
MRIINRFILILVLAALFLAGFFAVIYGLGILGYRMADLQSSLNLQGAYSGLDGFVSGIEQGALTAAGIAILTAIAVAGLILLILELKPRTPRRVRMQKGTYVTRRAVDEEVKAAAEGTPSVVSTSTKVKARRSPGAKVDLRADVRRGEDQKTLKNNLKSAVERRLASVGVPLGGLSIKLNETDPRQSSGGSRVR